MANTLICGGTIGKTVCEGKQSKIVELLSHMTNAVDVFNGVLPMPEDISSSDLIIWMPNIDNEIDKDYPVKKKGAVLICSKVMREGYTDADALKRVFDMHGNAVIKVYSEIRPYKFQLLDALGNNWTDKTDNLMEIARAILNLYEWTNNSVRVSLRNDPANYNVVLENGFVEIIQETSKKVVNQCASRFFGNFSTRCTKLFPSSREQQGYVFSPRNLDKSKIEHTDGIYCEDGVYFGDRKPSVDTPVQIELYKKNPLINYMIHGHAFIKDAPFTAGYYPCGDLRELGGILHLFNCGYNVINLKNHGFLICSGSLQALKVMTDIAEFYTL